MGRQSGFLPDPMINVSCYVQAVVAAPHYAANSDSAMLADADFLSFNRPPRMYMGCKSLLRVNPIAYQRENWHCEALPIPSVTESSARDAAANILVWHLTET
jgi:hypothetical protein